MLIKLLSIQAEKFKSKVIVQGGVQARKLQRARRNIADRLSEKIRVDELDAHRV